MPLTPKAQKKSERRWALLHDVCLDFDLPTATVARVLEEQGWCTPQGAPTALAQDRGYALLLPSPQAHARPTCRWRRPWLMGLLQQQGFKATNAPLLKKYRPDIEALLEQWWVIQAHTKRGNDRYSDWAWDVFIDTILEPMIQKTPLEDRPELARALVLGLAKRGIEEDVQYRTVAARVLEDVVARSERTRTYWAKDYLDQHKAAVDLKEALAETDRPAPRRVRL